jgi:hypothetical protein
MTYAPVAYESVTVANTAIGLTASSTAAPIRNAATLTLETAQIRFRVDGTDPTSSEGHLLEIGDTLELCNQEEVKNFKAIRTGSTSGVLKVSYFRGFPDSGGY